MQVNSIHVSASETTLTCHDAPGKAAHASIATGTADVTCLVRCRVDLRSQESPVSVSANEILLADVRAKLPTSRDLSTTLEAKSGASRKAYAEAENEQRFGECSQDCLPFTVFVADFSF